jgi:hypothetical protein
VVLAISGKALLLVDDPAVGETVIGEVSLRALRRAPGLEVTGVVGPAFDPALAWRPGSPESLPDTGGRRPFTHVEAACAENLIRPGGRSYLVSAEAA